MTIFGVGIRMMQVRALSRDHRFRERVSLDLDASLDRLGGAATHDSVSTTQYTLGHLLITFRTTFSVPDRVTLSFRLLLRHC